MKSFFTLFIFLFFSSANTFSQNYIYKMYRFECSELFDLTLKKPKGFKVIDGMIPFNVSNKDNVGTFGRMLLQSKNKDCLILFPLFLMNREHDRATRNMVYAELKAGLGLNVDNKTIEIDTAKYVKTITGVDMRDYFNADTVFITKIPLQKSYDGVYNYCIGINVLKAGHPSAMIKVLFTEEGKKKEEEYITALFNSIKYSDVTPEFSQEKVEKTRKKLRSRYIFYIKKYGPTY